MDPRDVSEVTMWATVTVQVKVPDLLDAMAIERADWDALDTETQWAVLQSLDATDAAMRMVLGNRDGGKVMENADEHGSDAAEPATLAALRYPNGIGGTAYWNRRNMLSGRAIRFLGGKPIPPLSEKPAAEVGA